MGAYFNTIRASDVYVEFDRLLRKVVKFIKYAYLYHMLQLFLLLQGKKGLFFAEKKNGFKKQTRYFWPYEAKMRLPT